MFRNDSSNSNSSQTLTLSPEKLITAIADSSITTLHIDGLEPEFQKLIGNKVIHPEDEAILARLNLKYAVYSYRETKGIPTKKERKDQLNNQILNLFYRLRQYNPVLNELQTITLAFRNNQTIRKSDDSNWIKSIYLSNIPGTVIVAILQGITAKVIDKLSFANITEDEINHIFLYLNTIQCKRIAFSNPTPKNMDSIFSKIIKNPIFVSAYTNTSITINASINDKSHELHFTEMDKEALQLATKVLNISLADFEYENKENNETLANDHSSMTTSGTRQANQLAWPPKDDAPNARLFKNHQIPHAETTVETLKIIITPPGATH